MTLVDTAAAAVAVGTTTAGFKMWARRHGLQPTARERRGRSTVALYDLGQVYRADADTRVDPLPPRSEPPGVTVNSDGTTYAPTSARRPVPREPRP